MGPATDEGGGDEVERLKASLSEVRSERDCLRQALAAAWSKQRLLAERIEPQTVSEAERVEPPAQQPAKPAAVQWWRFWERGSGG